VAEAKIDPLIGRAPSSNAGFNKLIQVNGYFKFEETKKYLHRVVYYKAFPRTPRNWHVHHINGRKTDNSLENLIALPAGVHQNLHKKWGMWELPHRQQIIGWWKGKKPKRKKPTKKQKRLKKLEKKRNAHSFKMCKRYFMETGKILSGFENHPIVLQTIGEWERNRLRASLQETPKKVGHRFTVILTKNGRKQVRI
jgi:hypothetical protein